MNRVKRKEFRFRRIRNLGWERFPWAGERWGALLPGGNKDQQNNMLKDLNHSESQEVVFCLMLTENPSLPLSFLSLENRVKETLHKAFWDNLEEQLSASPPDYTQAIQLLQEIKEVSCSWTKEDSYLRIRLLWIITSPFTSNIPMWTCVRGRRK